MPVECRQQAFVNAPLDRVWQLVADPDRQTEWWPDKIEFECIDGRFEEGCRVRNVEKRPWPLPDQRSTLEVETLTPGRELTIRCLDTGTFTRAVLTEGQGGTFVELEAGWIPRSLSNRAQAAVAGKRLFRHWIEHAIETLRTTAEERRPPAA
jgi:uncharacterized protein YndB with AHSA1/START domain